MASLVDSSDLKQLMAQIGTKLSELRLNFFSLKTSKIIKLLISPSLFYRSIFQFFQLSREFRAHNPKFAGSNSALVTILSLAKSVFKLAHYFSGSHPDSSVPTIYPTILLDFLSQSDPFLPNN